MRVVGIDPGLDGAAALWDGGSDVDVCTFESGAAQKGSGRELDGHALAAKIMEWDLSGIDHAFVELVGAMPREGTSGAFKFGTTYGIVLGVLYACGVPFTRVSPTRWQAETIGIGKEASKERAMARCRDLFPRQARMFAGSRAGGAHPLAQASGCADAALIAYYGWCKLSGRRA